MIRCVTPSPANAPMQTRQEAGEQIAVDIAKLRDGFQEQKR